ncbi:MAG: lysoplasmalogenase family protein [Promethearchaeota archaeon]
MILIIYSIAFWIFALVFTLISSIQDDEISIKSDLIKKMPRPVSILIKAVPAGLAIIFIFLLRPSDAIFYFLMMLGLLFCLLGDVGMEIGLLPGLGLFALAQIDFTVTFLLQSLALGITTNSILLLGLTIFIVAVYAILLLRYLHSSEAGLGKFRIPILFYACVISAMLCSSVLLWVTSGVLQGIVIVAGATIFVISDSLIGTREFHHKISKAAIKVMGTYYLAIFLLSLNVLIYIF